MPFRRILVAVDNSSYAMHAAGVAFGLARDLGAEAGIIYVIDPTREVVNADLGITPEHSRKMLLEEAETVIARYAHLYEGHPQVYRFTPEGKPAEEILRVAKEWHADVIVMGTHGRSGLKRMLTGSVAEHVLRHADVPVMVVPPGMVAPENA